MLMAESILCKDSLQKQFRHNLCRCLGWFSMEMDKWMDGSEAGTSRSEYGSVSHKSACFGTGGREKKGKERKRERGRSKEGRWKAGKEGQGKAGRKEGTGRNLENWFMASLGREYYSRFLSLSVQCSTEYGVLVVELTIKPRL